MTRLLVDNARLGYADKVICPGVDLEIPDGRFTVIVGPNAGGKSTLLKSLTRLIAPQDGQIRLDGQSLHSRPTKDVAREGGLLPQRSEEHTSELQSRGHLVCRLLLEKKNPIRSSSRRPA